MDKASLRQTLRTRRRSLDAEALREAGHRAAARLLALPCWSAARTVALHLAVRGELPTDALLEAAWAQGKRVALPRMSGGRMELRVVTASTGLAAGAHRIPEPPAEAPALPADAVDLVVAPGLAFDRAGRRLGQGGGDYDRLLAAVRADCATVGWCHAFQLVDQVPVEAHDRPVARVITPEGDHAAAR